VKGLDVAHALRERVRLPGRAIALSIGIVQMSDLIPSFFSAVLLAALSAPVTVAGAEKQSVRVAHVADGATLEVLLDAKTRKRVRLGGIEIPREGQAYYLRARQSLIAICGGEVATLEHEGSDRQGVMLAQVRCNGKSANAEQVRLGLARVTERNGESTPELKAAENEAKAARRGLWAPSPPSEKR
jgi:endonuclease YncB( thermonuclease family)